MNQSIEETLKKLNRESFQAEDDHSRNALDPFLANDFRIVRSNFIIEDKPAMLCRVAADTSRRRRQVDAEDVKVYGDSAVVACRVTLKEENGKIFGYFWNTKVFVRQQEDWKCVVWQVARIPEKTAP